MVYNFLFHRVSPIRETLWDPMDLVLFEKCIKYISKKFKVVLAEEYYLSPEKELSNKKTATIMFDDGYKDNIEFAAPILKKYNCKASFYVVTNCIDKNEPTWTQVLENQFLNTKKTRLNLKFDFLPSSFNVENLILLNERKAFVSKLKPVLKNINHKKRTLVLNKISKMFNDVSPQKNMMSWNDLRKLENYGHYIGSHTVSHPALSTIDNIKTLKYELEYSAQRIKQELGYFPLSISYPVGSFNETTKKVSKEVGYKLGLAVNQNIHNPKIEDVFEISRIELYNESWFKTKLRINNSLEKIKRLIKF